MCHKYHVKHTWKQYNLGATHINELGRHSMRARVRATSRTSQTDHKLIHEQSGFKNASVGENCMEANSAFVPKIISRQK